MQELILATSMEQYVRYRQAELEAEAKRRRMVADFRTAEQTETATKRGRQAFLLRLAATLGLF